MRAKLICIPIELFSFYLFFSFKAKLRIFLKQQCKKLSDAEMSQLTVELRDCLRRHRSEGEVKHLEALEAELREFDGNGFRDLRSVVQLKVPKLGTILCYQEQPFVRYPSSTNAQDLKDTKIICVRKIKSFYRKRKPPKKEDMDTDHKKVGPTCIKLQFSAII